MSLKTTMMTAMVSDTPGAQGEPRLLEFYLNSIRNQSKLVTRGFSASMNTNITTTMIFEVPGAQDGSRLLEFYANTIQNQKSVETCYSGIFGVSEHNYHDVHALRGTWCPEWTFSPDVFMKFDSRFMTKIVVEVPVAQDGAGLFYFYENTIKNQSKLVTRYFVFVDECEYDNGDGL